MRAGIIRSFSHLGIGAAALVAIGGIGFTSIVAKREYVATHWSEFVIFDPGTDEAVKNGPAGEKVKAIESDLFANPPPPGFEIVRHRYIYNQINSPGFYAAKAAAIGLGITGLLTLAAFGFFRVLSWVATGLARG